TCAEHEAGVIDPSQSSTPATPQPNQTASLETQMIPMTQYLPGRTLRHTDLINLSFRGEKFPRVLACEVTLAGPGPAAERRGVVIRIVLDQPHAGTLSSSASDTPQRTSQCRARARTNSELQSVPIRLTQTPTIYSMRQPWRRNAVRRRIDKGSGQFLTVLKSGGGLKSLRKLNSEEGWVNGKHIQRGSCW